MFEMSVYRGVEITLQDINDPPHTYEIRIENRDTNYWEHAYMTKEHVQQLIENLKQLIGEN